MMTVQECINYVESHLEVRYATENGAYTCGRTINPKGSVNHSVGCAQPNVDVFYKLMNKESCGWGVNAILGDFHKGEGRILLTLKYNSRPWGCGAGSKGSWNNSKVQWEICEPAGHTYAGGTMIGYDVAKNQQFFDRMWKMVVAWNVYMVKKFGYPVSGISDHAESYKAGYGSNHSDVGQGLFYHLIHLGFTNRLALYIMIFLAAGLAGGFYLALKSIQYNYAGALACWTIVFTPIGTAASIVLSQIVRKSTIENSSADGEGIKYAAAKANGFIQTGSDDSPGI